MSEQLHKCHGCDRQIPESINFCVYCKSDLRKKGLCLKCGQNPIKTREQCRGQLAFTCMECSNNRDTLKGTERLDWSTSFKKIRTQDHRENRYETRNGRD